MSKFDEYRGNFIKRKTIEDISEDHIVFFVLFFVETYCMDFCKRKVIHKVSRPPLPLKNMLGLILLSEVLKESSARKIADFTKTDSVYKTGYGRYILFLKRVGNSALSYFILKNNVWNSVILFIFCV